MRRIKQVLDNFLKRLAEFPVRPEWRGGISSALTLLALIAIGYLGHRTHWTLPFSGSHKGGHSANSTDDHAIHGVAPTHVQEVNAGDSTRTELNRVVFRSPASVQKSGIAVAKAELRPLKLEVAATGMVQYDQRSVARLSSRVPGAVWRVEKHWGDEVKKGDVLAIIDAADVGRLKSDFARALVEKQLKESIVTRLKTSGDGVPARQLAEAIAAQRAAKIGLLSAEQALLNLGFQLSSADFESLAEEEVFQRLRTLGISEAQQKRFDGQVMSSNLLPVVAPFDGLIVGKDIGLGETVDPNRPFYEMADVSKMWVMLDIRKEDSNDIVIGQEVEFQVDGIIEPLNGRLSWISTEVNERTRTLQARMELENPVVDADRPHGPGNRLLRANMFGRGKVKVRERMDALALPTNCLQTDGDGLVVFVQTGEKTFEGRRVEKGIVQDQLAEVIGPIQAGEFVASQGSHILKSEMLLARLRSSQ